MDAFEAPYWNQTQTFAWVYNGDRELVRECADNADPDRYWIEVVTPDGERKLIECKGDRPASIYLHIKAVLRGGAAMASIRDAEDTLISALQQGKLAAIGLANNNGDPKKIPATAWTGLKFYWEEKGEPCAGPDDPFRNGTWWYALKFSRQEVLALWGDPLQMVVSDDGPSATFATEYDPVPVGTVGFHEAAAHIQQAIHPARADEALSITRSFWTPQGEKEIPVSVEFQRKVQDDWRKHGEEARGLLLAALQDGKLHAHFLDGETRLKVPLAYWRTSAATAGTIITGRLESGDDIFVHLNAHHLKPCFLDARSFNKWLDFLGGDKPGTNKRAAANSEKKCREWLVNQMCGGAKSKSKSKFQEEANRKFPKIYPAAFRRAWTGAIAESGDPYGWGHSGRLKKGSPE
ncbi:MAG: hypothetical protein GY789_10825 [Hyphomicrobiales bacterium]|nr:hypothetical protein [Hyphomicrobiales bacterium]